MSIVNLMANDVWSEADIVAHGRATVAAQVSDARQNELRTILLGHLGKMRVATPEELAEIALVQSLTEAAALANAEARADMTLLQSALDYEAGVIQEVSEEVLALVALRHPAIPDEDTQNAG